jgi:hypothetical protein
MNDEGLHHLKETLVVMINSCGGGVRPDWRARGSLSLTTQEVLLSVKDTLTNWGARLKRLT